MRRWFIINDTHHPYQNKKALSLVLSIISYVYNQTKIGIILAGDIADIFGLNSHGSNPDVKESLKEEIEIVRDFLYELATKFPNAELVFIEGNHCHRLSRYLVSKAPEVYEFLNLDELIGINDYGFKFVPYGPNQQYNIPDTDIIVRHEGLSNGENPEKLSLKKGGCSMIFGHTHRVGKATITLFDGTVIRAINNGWLGDKSAPVFSYVKGHHNWQLHFTEIAVVGGEWYEQMCFIHEKDGEYSTKFDNDIWRN